MNEALCADRVIVMNDGRIILDGVPDEVFSHVEELKSVGLGVPQAAELMYSLSKNGIEIGKITGDENKCAQKLFDLINEK